MVWSSHVVHGLGDQLAAVRRLCQAAARHGRLALREDGGILRMLPHDVGLTDPGLEARLEVHRDRWFASWRASLPGAVRYPFGWAQLVHDAGCSHVTVRSFVLDVLPPFNELQSTLLHHRLRAWLDDADIGPWLSAADRGAPGLLTDAEDPRYALFRGDLHVRVVASV